LGKALLHNYDIEEIKMLYPNGLKPMTKNTITDFNILEEQLKEIRKGQIASETEETTEYLCCFAVPLVSKNKTIAALSISIPTFRATEDKINQAIQLLQKAKKKIDHFFTKMNIEKLTNM
jgi:DNA-binding IclR family transcriptional regulator